MLIFREQTSLRAHIGTLARAGKTLGFVPTMGALHPGHLSLVEAAAARADVVICSIFVNPTQFNDPEDFKKYPVRTDDDIRQLLAGPTDILFLPSVETVYGKGAPPPPAYDFGRLETLLEGAHRPGHFQGVGQVMARLLDLVGADYLFMGQKDYQQILIVKELINILNIKIDLVSCPIMREADGLAMSSRNLRLSPDARRKAPGLYRALLYVGDHLEEMPFPTLLGQATEDLTRAGFQAEYLCITDDELNLLEGPSAGPMVVLAAAWLDGVRLIDNLILR